MKVANDNRAPVGMTLLGIAFLMVMSLAFLWPRSPGNQTTGYSDGGEPVQSDSIKPLNPLTSSPDARTARR